MAEATEPMRITKYNFDELVPNSPISFATLTAAAYCPYNMMRGPKNFQNIRYLTYNELIDFMEKRIKRVGTAIGAKSITTISKANKVIEIANKMKEEK